MPFKIHCLLIVLSNAPPSITWEHRHSRARSASSPQAPAPYSQTSCPPPHPDRSEVSAFVWHSGTVGAIPKVRSLLRHLFSICLPLYSRPIGCSVAPFLLLLALRPTIPLPQRLPSVPVRAGPRGQPLQQSGLCPAAAAPHGRTRPREVTALSSPLRGTSHPSAPKPCLCSVVAILLRAAFATKLHNPPRYGATVNTAILRSISPFLCLSVLHKYGRKKILYPHIF